MQYQHASPEAVALAEHPLSVSDPTTIAESIAKDVPAKMLIRELLINAIHAAASLVGVEIWIDREQRVHNNRRVWKLFFMDTACGMSDTVLGQRINSDWHRAAG
jgi:hypothetical protein